MRTKFHIELFVTVLAILAATAASVAQTPRKISGSSAAPLNAAGTRSGVPQVRDCSCSGAGCSCSCKGPGCVCACDGGKCKCGNINAPTFSLAAGTTVQAVAKTLASLIGQDVLVLSGPEVTIPSDLKDTTPWQALARLVALPGVRLGVAGPTVEGTGRSLKQPNTSPGAPVSPNVREMFGSLQESVPGQAQRDQKLIDIRRLPPTEAVSLCADEAELTSVLDALSSISGLAFDVSGSPSGKFSLEAKGTVVEILKEIEAQTGTTIRIAE